ncbi:MAG: hypothetical protein ACHQ1H_03005 [Nitrososphaerales archaeon]
MTRNRAKFQSVLLLLGFLLSLSGFVTIPAAAAASACSPFVPFAGYCVTSSTSLTTDTITLKVPVGACKSPADNALFGLFLSGAGSSANAGVDVSCNTLDRPQYSVTFQICGQLPQTASFKVAPGQKIQIEMAAEPSFTSIIIKDATTGQSENAGCGLGFATTKALYGVFEGEHCIGIQCTPFLVHFRAVIFSNCEASLTPIGGFGQHLFKQFDSRVKVSPLSNTGLSFSATWLSEM